MAETEDGEKKRKWNAFLSTGDFDKTEQPEEGYQIGDYVTGKDGIGYLVKGFKADGGIILGLDRKPEGRERI